MQNQQTYSYSDSTRVKMVAGYALHQKLGSGSFAVVYKGVRVPQQVEQPGKADTVAIKAITRDSEKLTKKVLQNLEVEIQILRTYRHRNIVCLHDVQKTERHFYLILEYCGGGDVQKLIRTRKAGRLTENLTRRLMRDLAAGLKFLWGQELIHRDIKPQNLLLTGPLPLDEMNDPEKLDEREQRRREANFPSEQFALKIADFGFARHLQTASLAETLCGSPLYMAPEILQQNRYDAKADLWSVGTVLFEMITGHPPFEGANHIDLLRNIQRKAVRLPPDVKVSKECVALLRLLLNRSPMSRAGFKEFFDACTAFVALGCQGIATQDEGSCQRPTMDLGTIPENDGSPTSGGSMLNTIGSAPVMPQHTPTRHQSPGVVTPPLGPAPSPTPPAPIPQSLAPTPAPQVPSAAIPIVSQAVTPHGSRKCVPLAPLVPSPPSSSVSPLNGPRGALVPPPLDHRLAGRHVWPQPAMEMTSPPSRQSSLSPQQSSTEENSFVMVEHGSCHGAVVPANTDPTRRRMEPSPPTSPAVFMNKNPMLSTRGEYMVVKQPKGMLSTSPGTGGALMNLLSGRARLGSETVDSNRQLDSKLAECTKMLAAAEDVGRRAIAIAHLGDQRALAAMRLLLMNESSSSAVPMEGIEEEAVDGAVTDDDSRSTEVMSSIRRRRSSSATDKSMADVKPDDELEEMPFAVNAEPTPVLSAAIPTRESSSSFSKSASITSANKAAVIKPTPAVIRLHLSEALSCYVKGLTMLKGAVAAVQRVAKDMESFFSQRVPTDKTEYLDKMKKRCQVTASWLAGQFKGVLERGDATNVEISKLSASQGSQDKSEVLPMVSVEELIYNHSLAFGREGAVKQLLGQYEAARASYRTAGLLAETLLMESGMGADDRKILEEYVDGFAARITELDDAMLQQSRLAASSATGSMGSSKRGQPVVGLIGTLASFTMDPRNR